MISRDGDRDSIHILSSGQGQVENTRVHWNRSEITRRNRMMDRLCALFIQSIINNISNQAS